MKYTAILAFILLLPMTIAQANTPVTEIHQLARQWAKANYTLHGEAKKHAFEQLNQQVEARKQRYPQSAEIWIWSGIIKSTYAKVKGGLGALGYAKQAKADLEHAMKLDDSALSGSAYTCLATLYYKVPGWPLGFGDDDKARALFHKALAIDPNDMNANYFYGRFLIDQNQLDLAITYLLKARAQIPEDSTDIADQGRLREIAKALKKIDRKRQQQTASSGFAFDSHH